MPFLRPFFPGLFGPVRLERLAAPVRVVPRLTAPEALRDGPYAMSLGYSVVPLAAFLGGVGAGALDLLRLNKAGRVGTLCVVGGLGIGLLMAGGLVSLCHDREARWGSLFEGVVLVIRSYGPKRPSA